MLTKLEKKWFEILKNEFEEPYFLLLQDFIKKERKKNKLYPPREKIFSAFSYTPFNRVEVVIIGQDPYHNAGKANGLAFSVEKEVSLPPSLRNIYKEIESDLDIKMSENGNLIGWAKQGVLLLNSILTVRHKEPHSHYKKGWEKFTDKVVEVLVNQNRPIVFLLWGKVAQEKCLKFFDEKKSSKHLMLKAAHPSFYSSARFFGCNHFSKANAFLERNNRKPINWSN